MTILALFCIAAAGSMSDWPTSSVEWVWFTFGMIGNAIFGGRFFLQWIHSEKHRESIIPISFWWLSVLGTVILAVYFCRMRQWVALLGNGPQIVPYTRNLVLIYRKRREQNRLTAAGSAPTPAAGNSEP